MLHRQSAGGRLKTNCCVRTQTQYSASLLAHGARARCLFNFNHLQPCRRQKSEVRQVLAWLSIDFEQKTGLTNDSNKWKRGTNRWVLGFETLHSQPRWQKPHSQATALQWLAWSWCALWRLNAIFRNHAWPFPKLVGRFKSEKGGHSLFSRNRSHGDYPLFSSQHSPAVDLAKLRNSKTKAFSFQHSPSFEAAAIRIGSNAGLVCVHLQILAQVRSA